MNAPTAVLNTESNYLQSTLGFLKQKTEGVSHVLGHCFANLSAISDDRETLIKAIRKMRHFIAAYFLTYGDHNTLRKIDKRWRITAEFLEGIQFVKSLEIFFPEPTNRDLKESCPNTFSVFSIEKAKDAFFCLGDLAGGCIWLLDLNIPVLGPYSSSAKVVAFIANTADKVFLAGYFTESALVVNRIIARRSSNLNLLNQTGEQLDLLKLAENVTGAAYLIFSIMGAPSLTIGFGIASTTIGVGSFIYKRHMVRATAPTV